MDDPLLPFRDLAYKKLELILDHEDADLTVAAVTMKLSQSGQKAVDCYVQEEDQRMIVRYQKESDLVSGLEYISDNASELGFTARRRHVVVNALPEEDKITVHERFPEATVSAFMACYEREFCCLPTQTEPPVAMKPVRFSMKPDGQGHKALKKYVKNCFECKQKTSYTCSLTGDYICSVECQEMWMKGQATATAPDDRTFLLVGYASARCVYVRATRDQDTFLRLMNDIAVQGHKEPYFRTKAALNKAVLAKHHNIWYRGTVTEVVKKATVRVLLPDLGLEQVYSIKQLKMPHNDVELMKVPANVRKCTLASVIRDGLSYECEKLFETLMAEQTPLVMMAGKGGAAAKEDEEEMLFQVDHVGGLSLSEVVNKAMVMEVTNDGPSHYLKDLPVTPIVAMENVPMLVTDLSDCELAVSLAHGEHFKRCYRYESHFQEFAESSVGVYTPCDKELVVVRLTNMEGTKTRWLRAYGLLNRGDRHPRVELLDYGLVAKVNIADVRKLPKELLYPAATWTYKSLDRIDPGDLIMGQRLKTVKYALYPVVVDKIEPASEEKPTDKVSCPNLIGQINDVLRAQG